MEEASHRQKQRTRSNCDSELLDMTRHNKFRWRVGKVQLTLPKRQDALLATKRCARTLANHKAGVEKNLESLIKWFDITSTWSLRIEQIQTHGAHSTDGRTRIGQDVLKRDREQRVK